MRRIIALSILVMAAAITMNAQEWVELFNGKNFKGWEKLDGKAEYKVEDGTVIGTSQTGTPNSFMATKKVYGDFILEYEMKMDRGLNSGVQFRSVALKPDGTERVNGYQVECDDTDTRPWAGGIYEEASRGWMYPMSYNQCVAKAKINKHGEWNKIRVEAVGSTIRTYINGVSFANLVDDARKEGIIALQVHGIGNKEELNGKEIAWRNIRIITEEPGKYILSDVELSPEVSYLNNELTSLEKEEGWKLLWDGKSSEGWRGAKLDAFPLGGWAMEDGILSVDKGDGGESTNGGDIVTIKKYKDFILEVDFMITYGANSGIKYFVDPDLNTGAGSAIGCEYQILDDKNHPDAKKGIPGTRTLGSLYDLIHADALLYGEDERSVRFNGVGSWNRARIEVHGSTISHHLNGVKIVEYERGTQMWKALVAYSKYKNWPAFGEAETGHILLQDHGDAVSFKNVKILEL
jgi:3-keto-disaccharide hydrolase